MTSSLPGNARALLEPALDHAGEYDWSEVERRIEGNTAQLWLGNGCAMVTEIVDGAIHGWLAGGDLNGVLALIPHIERTARFWGCDRATLRGRRGWIRALAPLGYRWSGDVLEKSL